MTAYRDFLLHQLIKLLSGNNEIAIERKLRIDCSQLVVTILSLNSALPLFSKAA